MKKTTAQINDFLNSLELSQRMYISSCLDFARKVRNVIEEFKIDKETFCKRLEIPIEKFHSFTTGGYNYDLRNFAAFQAMHTGLLIDKKVEEAAKEAEVLKLGPYKYEEPIRQTPLADDIREVIEEALISLQGLRGKKMKRR